MDDIAVVMTPFGDVVTVSLVANSYDSWFRKLNISGGGNDKN